MDMNRLRLEPGPARRSTRGVATDSRLLPRQAKTGPLLTPSTIMEDWYGPHQYERECLGGPAGAGQVAEVAERNIAAALQRTEDQPWRRRPGRPDRQRRAAIGNRRTGT